MHELESPSPFTRPPEGSPEAVAPVRPPVPKAPPPTLLVLASLTTVFAADLAVQMLTAAETQRRESSGTFDPSARGEPTADWGLAGQIISRATHHLDESVPNGQRDRTSAAMGALLIGVAMLERALAERGVSPARLHHAEQDPEG